ncbi:MAG: glutamine synthetase beta-grasp domain-containing protein [Candidatus Hodarchaeales archaeon]|jgi:glutamine synthetase
MRTQAEYIWIDGTKPVPRLRSKTKILNVSPSGSLYGDLFKFPVDHKSVPTWGFDGSSTGQAEGDNSDCILVPCRVVHDPLKTNAILVLCEVYNNKLEPDENNHRVEAKRIADKYEDQEALFGIEQEYTFFKGRDPLGWPDSGYPAPQGPFYCGVGADEVFGRQIVTEHVQACLRAGLNISGVNAEVMPGQWEFQVGPSDALEVADHLWLARYILYRIAESHGVNVKLDPKPVPGDWNGAGAHTNFSTKAMREDGGIEQCVRGASLLGCRASERSEVNEGEVVDVLHFPEVYGHGYERRLTGAHETCSYEQFKFGVGDRTASIRIPLHVKKNGKGYIEDRRPCANIDPYQITAYLMDTICR